MHRKAFFISDRTGITAEALGRSLLTQFDGLNFDIVTLPFVDTEEKAHEAIAQFSYAEEETGYRAIVFSTIITESIRVMVEKSNAIVLDFFKAFISPLEQELGVRSNHSIGKSHGIQNDDSYKIRLDAINYTLNCDDGLGIQHYHKADIILVGVSRCGKTPTSLFLAMQYGLSVANYPLTEEDFTELKLPSCLREHREKIVGLTIDPDRLSSIRNERRANSQYASIKKCRDEIFEAEAIFTRESIPRIDTSQSSIEEIAVKAMSLAGLKRVT